MSNIHQLQLARQTLHSATQSLNTVHRISPRVANMLSPKLRSLWANQTRIENQIKARTQRTQELGIPPLIIGAGLLTLIGTGGFFGLKISEQLTEATDFKERLDQFERAKGLGLTDEEALELVGLGKGASFSPLLIIGGLATIGALIFITRK